MPLDVLVQQLDGRVERVINAVLVSLRDEGWLKFGERAVIVPSITAGDMVSYSVAETFSPAEQEVGRRVSQISSLSLL